MGTGRSPARDRDARCPLRPHLHCGVKALQRSPEVRVDDVHVHLVVGRLACPRARRTGATFHASRRRSVRNVWRRVGVDLPLHPRSPPVPGKDRLSARSDTDP